MIKPEVTLTNTPTYNTNVTINEATDGAKVEKMIETGFRNYDTQRIKELNPTGDMFYSLFKRYRGGSFSTGLKMYDSTAIAYLLAPEIYQLSSEYVTIETKGEFTQGASLIDINKKMGKEENAIVAIDVNADEFRKWFVSAVEKCKVG